MLHKTLSRPRVIKICSYVKISIIAKFGWGVCNFFVVNMLHTGRLVFGEV